jgi:hypothetical protein
MEYSLLAICGTFESHENPPLIIDSLQFVIVLCWKKLNSVKLEPRYSGLTLEAHMAAQCYVTLQYGWVGDIMWDIWNKKVYF